MLIVMLVQMAVLVAVAAVLLALEGQAVLVHLVKVLMAAIQFLQPNQDQAVAEQVRLAEMVHLVLPKVVLADQELPLSFLVVLSHAVAVAEEVMVE